MKKLILLLFIPLLFIYSCDRSVTDDMVSYRDLWGTVKVLDEEWRAAGKPQNSEINEEILRLIAEMEEIISYYVYDSNEDVASLFILLLSKEKGFEWIDDRQDLELELWNLEVAKQSF